MQLGSTTKLIGLCLGCLSIFLSSECVADEVIWEKNPNIFIKLIDIDTKEFSHPSSPSTPELNAFLTEVSIVNQNNQDAQPLFTDEQVKVLTEHLPKAFKQAKKNNVIVFSLGKTESSLAGMVKRDMFTAGAFYMQQDTLTLSVGDVNKERARGFEAVYDPTNLGLVRYTFNYGLEGSSSLNKNSQLGFSFVVDGIFQDQANHISLALANFSKPIHNNQSALSGQATNTPNVGLNRQEVEQIISQREAQFIAKTQNTIEQKQNSNTAIESSAQTNKTHPKSLEERFKVLEKLKKEGLISIEEYETKRKELLAEI